MIFPGLNFTVARAGITKLLPGSFGFRPTRGFVKRGWKTPKFRNSTATLLARLSVMIKGALNNVENLVLDHASLVADRHHNVPLS